MANKIQDKLRSMMRNEQTKNAIPDALCFGRIVQENPIVIMLNDKIPLEINDLIIPEDLLEHTEQVTATTSTNGGTYSHSHTVTSITFPSKLKEGKLVVLYGLQYKEISRTYQKYLVLKVI